MQKSSYHSHSLSSTYSSVPLMLIRSSLSVHLLLSLLWYTAVFCTNYPANTSDEIGNLTKILKSGA